MDVLLASVFDVPACNPSLYVTLRCLEQPLAWSMIPAFRRFCRVRHYHTRGTAIWRVAMQLRVCSCRTRSKLQRSNVQKTELLVLPKRCYYLGSTDREFLQKSMEIFVNIFERIGLKTNAGKTKTMTCIPGKIRTSNSEETYTRTIAGVP